MRGRSGVFGGDGGPGVMKKLPVLALPLLVVALVGCDHATKGAARSELRGQPPTVLLRGALDLRYVENRDMAFSTLRSLSDDVKRPLAIGFAALGIPLLAVWWFRRRAAPWPERLALALMLAGAAGNLLDRVFRGYVIDFIHVRYWPVFNVADVCITAGVILFLWKGLHWEAKGGEPR
jgi:signal peptidase II